MDKIYGSVNKLALSLTKCDCFKLQHASLLKYGRKYGSIKFYSTGDSESIVVLETLVAKVGVLKYYSQ